MLTIDAARALTSPSLLNQLVFSQQGPELGVHLVIPRHMVDVGQDAVEDNLLELIGETAENKIPALGDCKAV